MQEITFVNADDWQGLYINNNLILQNHKLNIVDILNAIGIKFDYIEADQDWLYSVGQLPEDLKEVKEYKD